MGGSCGCASTKTERVYCAGGVCQSCGADSLSQEITKNEKHPRQLKLWIHKMVRRADRGGMDGNYCKRSSSIAQL